MAVSRSRLDSGFIEEMRRRIDLVQTIDALNETELKLKQHVNGEIKLTQDQLQAAKVLKGVADTKMAYSMPRLAQIEGLPDQINDNRTIIQVIQFASNTNPSNMAPASLPAPVVELPGARGEEI